MPSLKILPKVSWTTVMWSPMPMLAAELALDVGRGGEVVGMHVRLDQPFEAEAVRAEWAMISSAERAAVRPAA